MRHTLFLACKVGTQFDEKSTGLCTLVQDAFQLLKSFWHSHASYIHVRGFMAIRITRCFNLYLPKCSLLNPSSPLTTCFQESFHQCPPPQQHHSHPWGTGRGQTSCPITDEESEHSRRLCPESSSLLGLLEISCLHSWLLLAGCFEDVCHFTQRLRSTKVFSVCHKTSRHFKRETSIRQLL